MGLIELLSGVTRQDTAILSMIERLLNLHERTVRQFDAELAEIRDGLVDQDHRLAATRQEVASLDDALSVLRNDYRGEGAA